MDKTKLALVGAGTIGKRHLKAIAEVEEAELTAIVDTDPHVEIMASERNVRFYSTTEAMLEDQKPEGVIVCTPTHLHLEPVLASLGAKAHVLVEKPITATMSEAREIIDASRNGPPGRFSSGITDATTGASGRQGSSYGREPSERWWGSPECGPFGKRTPTLNRNGGSCPRRVRY